MGGESVGSVYDRLGQFGARSLRPPVSARFERGGKDGEQLAHFLESRGRRGTQRELFLLGASAVVGRADLKLTKTRRVSLSVKFYGNGDCGID